MTTQETQDDTYGYLVSLQLSLTRLNNLDVFNPFVLLFISFKNVWIAASSPAAIAASMIVTAIDTAS